MRRLCAWARWLDALLWPITSRIERAMRWLKDDWRRLAALAGIECVGIGVIVWLT